MVDRKMYIGIHGWGGSGKTWLAHTLPGPRLTLATEMGVWDTAAREDRPAKVRLWDPMNETVPTDLTEEDTVVVSLRDLKNLAPVMRLLGKGTHPFESVILDSLTEMQAMLKTIVAKPGEQYDPDATFDQQAWGRLKNHGGLLLRDLRDLTWPDAVKPINVAVVMFSNDEVQPAVPLLEGGIRKNLIGWFDVIGYLFTVQHPETQQEVRVLQISRNQTATAKCNLHTLKKAYGTHIENPDLTTVYNKLNGANNG